MTNEIVNQEEDIRNPWDQLDNEPDDWYERFDICFLGFGISRSLNKAYLFHQSTIESDPTKAPSPQEWSKAARKFDWKRRAEAFDRAQVIEARKRVEEARRELQEASLDAVKALKKSLGNNRTRVSGAKAILDRGGLPPVKELQHKVRPFTADELAAASEEVEEWERKMSEESG